MYGRTKIMQRIDCVKAKLDTLKPHYLEVIDETYMHRGHLDTDQQETHLKIKISANIFHGMTKVMQHNLINKLLADEFKQGLHALSIKVLT